MHTSKKLSLIIIVFILNNCSINNDSHTIINGQLDIHIPTETISSKLEFVKSSRFVFLDKNTPIGSIDKLIIDKKGSIIILDKMSQSVFMFTSEGKIIFQLNNKGRGPGEYSELTDIALNMLTDELIILDSGNRKILFYDLTTKSFIKEFFISSLLGSNIACSNKYIYVYNPILTLYSENSEEFNYSIFVFDMKGLPKYKVFKDYLLGDIGLVNQAFYTSTDKNFFINKFDYLIYQLDDGDVIPKLNIIFEGNDNFQKFISLNHNDDFSALTESSYSYFISNFSLINDIACFNYVKERKKYSVVLDCKTSGIMMNEYNQVKLSNYLIENEIPIFKFPQYAYNNEFVTIMEPNYIKSIYNRETNITQIPPHLEDVINQFINLDVSDNPVIGFYKFEF